MRLGVVQRLTVSLLRMSSFVAVWWIMMVLVHRYNLYDLMVCPYVRGWYLHDIVQRITTGRLCVCMCYHCSYSSSVCVTPVCGEGGAVV
jgi:hypothetical protein